MYWTIGEWQELIPDGPQGLKAHNTWRIISGPHRSKVVAEDAGHWEVRRNRVRPGDTGWQLKSFRVVKAEHLGDYGLRMESRAWQLRMKLDGESE